MKKILALLLMFLYCIGFASCSLISNDSDNNTNISTKDPVEIRTTITKEEWNAALASGNYSVLSNCFLPLIPSGDRFSSGGGEVIKITNDCYSIDFYSKSETAFDSLFCNRIDGVLYIIEKTNETYVASKLDAEEDDNYPHTENLTTWFLSLFYLDWNAVYDCLVYVEDCKTYRGVLGSIENDGIDALQIEMECENGNIKKLRLYLTDRDIREPLNGLFTFYDFGTTVVELPEYTFANE